MNEALKRLRIKFVAIIMAVVTIILLVVFSVIVSLSYHNSIDEVHQALEQALRHDSIDVERSPVDRMPPTEEALPNRETPRFEIGGRAPDQSLIPVAVYEIADGQLLLASNAASGTVADAVIDDAAAQAISLPDGQGFLDSLGVYYLKETHGEHSLIAFADEQSVSGWKSLAWLLAGVGAGALILFFVMSLLLSKWILRPVKASWQQQQRFIADASHELKTPLTVIAADVAILKRHPEKSIANQSQWIESIEAESEHMHELVSDMLLLAHVDSQAREDACLVKVDLSKLVSSNVLQFEPLAYEREITFTSTIAEGLEVKAEKDKLQRLIGVLFDNAFKYVDEHGSIAISLEKANDKAKLSVSNSGPAIPGEDLPHLFDRFYRSDKARTRNEEQSYGLGLSIAREIAQAYGGEISVASSEEGTTFTTALPLAYD